MRYLGTITGASGAYNNWQNQASGATGFTIPKGVRSLFLQPSASGLFFEIGSSGLETSAARGALLPISQAGGVVASVPQQPAGPFRAPGVDGGTVVAIYSTQGLCNVRVFGSDGPG